MRKFAFAAVILLLVGSAAFAQFSDTDSHLVTVQVTEIAYVTVVGGDLTLPIVWDMVTGVGSASDNTQCDLEWVTNSATTKKITVASNLGAPAHSLWVVGQNITGMGALQAEVQLGDPVGGGPLSGDFVRDIDAGSGNCDLAYRAEALLSEAVSNDVHTVTYTILDQ